MPQGHVQLDDVGVGISELVVGAVAANHEISGHIVSFRETF
jgi:hypothetical protein